MRHVTSEERFADRWRAATSTSSSTSLRPRSRSSTSSDGSSLYNPVTMKIAVIAGVGAGTGSALAHKFAKAYPVALLARSKENLDPVVKSIETAGGSAVGYVTDVTDEDNVEQTFAKIAKDFPESDIAAGIYNVGGAFKRGSFLEVTLKDFKDAQASNGTGAFLFSQQVLRNQVAGMKAKRFAEAEPQPTLIYTGATASLKGGPASSSFAAGKFAVRALSQSLAREFQPKGIHVAHAIIDGIIDIPRTKEYKVSDEPDSKMSTKGIAEAYWQLHVQHRSCWTQELDLRPWVEKF